MRNIKGHCDKHTITYCKRQKQHAFKNKLWYLCSNVIYLAYTPTNLLKPRSKCAIQISGLSFN